MFNAVSGLISNTTQVDSGQLVADLVNAARAPKDAALQARSTRNAQQISTLATITASLSTFADGLAEVVGGPARRGAVVSSDAGIVSASVDTTAPVTGLPTTITVEQLASARKLVSAPVADRAAGLGAGSMTITRGGQSFELDLAEGSDSLDGLAAAIRASGSGITASVLADENGARLLLRGSEGAGETFEITGDFADYNFPKRSTGIFGGSPRGLDQLAEAADALVTIDGVDLRYSSNRIDRAIEGVTIDLRTAAPGTAVTLALDTPAGGTKDAVTEFVNAYNALRAQLAEATRAGLPGETGGPLSGDRGIRAIIRDLGALGSRQLNPGGAYETLASIGVKTNNDGTLAIDAARLDAAITDNRGAVEAMLAGNGSGGGLVNAMTATRDALLGTESPLTASKDRFAQQAENIADERRRLDESSAAYEEQLQRNFANMDRQLAVLRATQSYLTQQIAVWSSGDN